MKDAWPVDQDGKTGVEDRKSLAIRYDDACWPQYSYAHQGCRDRLTEDFTAYLGSFQPGPNIAGLTLHVTCHNPSPREAALHDRVEAEILYKGRRRRITIEGSAVRMQTPNDLRNRPARATETRRDRLAAAPHPCEDLLGETVLWSPEDLQ